MILKAFWGIILIRYVEESKPIAKPGNIVKDIYSVSNEIFFQKKANIITLVIFSEKKNNAVDPTNSPFSFVCLKK